MTSKFLIALTLAVALVTGSAAVAPKAEAGVRVGFGFPLGILVAKSMMSQKNSGYGNESNRKRYYSAKKAYKDKSYEKSYASRKESTGSSARRSSVASTQRSKEKAATTVASTTKAEDEKDEVKKDEAKKTEETAAAEEATEETVDNGSDCKQFFPNIGKTLTVPCGEKTANKDKSESKDKSKDETAKDTKPATKSTSKTAAAQPKTDCKKFFPNVGMTVSVPCSE